MSDLEKSEHFKLLQDFYLSQCVKTPDDGHTYCNTTSDIFGCWNYTLPGTVMKKPCPDLPGFKPTAFAYKNCTENGTWYFNTSLGKFVANYDECYMTAEEVREKVEDDFLHIYISLVGFSISIALLLVSLLIFFKFRQLRCDRITLHKNLFISYLITAIMHILYYVLVVLDGDVLHDQPHWCVGIHVITQYCIVCNFAWMFCEGVYLHTIMVKTFTTGKWLLIICMVIGWVCPVVLVGIYTAVRAVSSTDNITCWHQSSNLQWIMFAPVVCSIFLNFIFLCNIVRLLITKLRQIPEAGQTRKAARATLILIPLLGIQYLLFPIAPDEGSSLHEVYLIIVALHLSLQGAFVSIIFCFCNGEVISVLKRKWKLHRESTFSSKRHRAPSSIGTTTYTLVDHVSGVATSAT